MRNTLARFCDTMQKQYDLYSHLRIVLCEEAEALKAQNIEMMNSITAKKEAIQTGIEDLKDIYQKDISFIARVFDEDETKINFSFLIAVAAEEFSAILTELQNKYQRVVAEVAELNYRNALLNDKTFYINNGWMNMLRSALVNQAGTYGPGGRAMSVSGNLSRAVC